MAPRSTRRSFISRWCSWRNILIVLCLVVIYVFFPRSTSSAPSSPSIPGAYNAKEPACPPVEYITITSKTPLPSETASPKLDPQNFVAGTAVTGRFRDSLRPDVNYLTGFCLGGFTNQFMCFTNLIYLGMISNRVPVVPPFTPSHHISVEAGTVPFGEVFDLVALRKTLNEPILEWTDIKAYPIHRNDKTIAVDEPLGCWNPRDSNPSGQSFHEHMRLDVSHTQTPTEMFINEGHWHDHTNLWNLAALLYPKRPLFEDRTFPVSYPSPKGNSAPPDRHMACLDTTYYMGSGAAPFEWERTWSPVWRYVGTRIKFSKKVNDIADKYLRRTFKLRTAASIPPFIAVHIRHGDFGRTCDSANPNDCYASLPAFARRVEEVKQELFEKRGIQATRVLVSSDDVSGSFWDQVEELGWKDIDHGAEQTTEKYGEWYLPVLDIATHSKAAGFVGTSGSTLSLVSARRVEDWNDGPTRMVNWGSRGADDH